MSLFAALIPSGPLRRLLVLVLLVLPVTACESLDRSIYHDRYAEMSREEYRQQLLLDSARGPAPEPPIPSLAPVIATPPPAPTGAAARRVTVSTDETVPVRELFRELAQLASLDLELDPAIDQSVIFTARDRPLIEVVDRISAMAGLRYSLDDRVLRVQRDTPYHRNHDVGFLSTIRTASGTVGSSVGITGPLAGGTSGGNVSRMELDSTTEVASGGPVPEPEDFWQAISVSLHQILRNSAAAGAVSTPTAARPDPTGAELAALMVDGQPMPALLDQTGNGIAGQAVGPTPRDEAYFTVNRQAGLVSVFGTERQHRLVDEYLGQLRQASQAQVLIEAKVFEVSLRESYRTGINWSRVLAAGVSGFGISAQLQPPPTALGATDMSGATNITVRGSDLEAVASFVEQFGTTRTLSSPRVTALHNSPAVLRVVENEVYFTIDVIPEIRNANGDIIQPRLERSIPNTVPIGVIINVQPSISAARQEVTLSLRPTITSIVRRVEDPVNDGSFIPVVQVQELDSVVTLRSGEALVMGGLMQDRAAAADRGVPFLSEVPLLGRLTSGRDDTTEVKELVIFLRAEIVPPAGARIGATDRQLYETFGRDRRPLF